MTSEPMTVEEYREEYKEEWNEEIKKHHNWVIQPAQNKKYTTFLLKFVCPRCQDASRHLLIYTSSDNGGLQIETLRHETFMRNQQTGSYDYITVKCKCRVQHDTSDQQSVGCGAYFRVKTPAAP